MLGKQDTVFFFLCIYSPILIEWNFSWVIVSDEIVHYLFLFFMMLGLSASTGSIIIVADQLIHLFFYNNTFEKWELDDSIVLYLLTASNNWTFHTIIFVVNRFLHVWCLSVVTENT